MPDNNQMTDEDSIYPIDLHFTQNYHSSYQSQQQQQLVQTQNGSATKNKKLFPKKLWDLINDHRYHYCLRWSEDGQSVYLNRDDFEDSYLKTPNNQFHTQKAISFVRQMNMYGFRKVDDCYYENDNFRRNCPQLLKNMVRRHSNKGFSTILTDQNNHLQDEQLSPDHNPFYQDQMSPIPNPSASATIAANINNNLSTNSAINSVTTPNSAQFYSENTCNEINQQHPNNLLLFHPDQKEIIEALMAQQQQQQVNNTHLPGDINQTNLTQEHNNFNSIHALLSSFNNHWYQQNLTIPSLQQLYQNLLLSQDCFVPTELHQKEQRPRCSGSSEVQSSTSNGTDLTTKSLLACGKSTNSSKQENGTGMTDNGFENGCELNTLREKAIDGHKGKLSAETDSSSVKRRDIRANRSFKRSVDSILDSHCSYGLIKTNGYKKTIINYERERNNDNNDKIATKYAKELVAQVALNKAARVDSNVIAEASRYTECFVQTLFDTAQVIARHSNRSSSSNSINENRPIAEDKESKDDKDMEGRNINLSDITSAVKLLPSKLPKILK